MIRRFISLGLAIIALTVIPCQTIQADRTEQAPKELDGVGITEHLDAPLPLNLEFTNEQGQRVALNDLLEEGCPVILTMNYSNCPMLCNLQLTGLVDALRHLEWDIGQNFKVVTVSIDPKETVERARLTRGRYVGEYGRPVAAGKWQFLTGKECDIKALAEAVGFNYRYNEERKEYLHAAAIMICTPNGRVSRYLYGIHYDPKTLRLSLVEASQGRIGSSVDQMLLFCFHYDSAKGRYAPAAQRLMQLGATVMIMVLGTYLIRTWRRVIVDEMNRGRKIEAISGERT